MFAPRARASARARRQDESGASRDEVAAALVEVAAGRVPKDRIALRELFSEMTAWPFVTDADEAAAAAAAAARDGGSRSPYESVTDTGAPRVQARVHAPPARPPAGAAVGGARARPCLSGAASPQVVHGRAGMPLCHRRCGSGDHGPAMRPPGLLVSGSADRSGHCM